MKITHTRCCYCRRTLDSDNKKLHSTRDHFIPTSKGGHDGENVLTCCFECNQWKSDKAPDVWLNRVMYYESKRTLYGTYTLFDYRQIIGSIRHWMKTLKGKKISEYKY